MWKIFDTRVSMRQDTTCNQGLIRRLRCKIVASLKADQQRQVETESGNIEHILTSNPPLHKESWKQMKGRYKVAHSRVSPPVRITI